MTDFLKMMQQAQEMTGKLQEVQETLARQTVTGSAGGGMVRVEAGGLGIPGLGSLPFKLPF